MLAVVFTSMNSQKLLQLHISPLKFWFVFKAGESGRTKTFPRQNELCIEHEGSVDKLNEELRKASSKTRNQKA